MTLTNRVDGPSRGQLTAKWLEPDEYLEMAISVRKMARCDEPDQGIRGLVDLATGQRYLIREEQALRSDLCGGQPRHAVSV